MNAERELLEAEVIRLWNDEKTAGTIASHFKVTRNVVIGIVNRARPHGRITRAAKPAPAAKREPLGSVDLFSVPTTPPVVEPPPAPVLRVNTPPAGDGPKTLIEAPMFTCRVVVGQNERGQDLYCCEPTYRLKNGEIGRISVCEAHKPRIFSKRALSAGTGDASDGAIDRLSTAFKREKRQHAGGKKFFTFGKTLGISNE